MHREREDEEDDQVADLQHNPEKPDTVVHLKADSFKEKSERT